MRTTIDLEDELFRQAKVKAAIEGISLKKLFERGLRMAVDSPTPAPGVRDLTSPIFKGRGEGTIAIPPDAAHRLDESEDKEHHEILVRR